MVLTLYLGWGETLWESDESHGSLHPENCWFIQNVAYNLFLSHTTLLSLGIRYYDPHFSDSPWVFTHIMSSTFKCFFSSPYPSAPLKVLPPFKAQFKCHLFSVKLLQSDLIFPLELCTSIITINIFGLVLQLLEVCVLHLPFLHVPQQVINVLITAAMFLH